MARTPTPQQASCIAAAVNDAIRMLKVEACAGSGKTSTLTMMADAHEVPSLYLAFNKVTATEAAEKFPRHVQCRTTHSMAYQAFGKVLQDKLSRPRGKYVNVAGTGSEIARYYKIDSVQLEDDKSVSSQFLGLLVKETVARFEQSADKDVETKHVPTQQLREKLHDNTADVAYCVKVIFGYAQKLWAERINLRSQVLATHDTYLKQFQLSKPVFGGIQMLYVDEFQDTTPCVLDIIMNQQDHMKVVMVGDARQAIYGWRGAVNAMQMVKCDALYLTKSFRYGQAVADIATTVLERDMVIEGNDTIKSKVGMGGLTDRTKPYCRLFRTNTALLLAAVDTIETGVEVAIEIDVKDFVKLLQSAEALHYGEDRKSIKHESIVPYDTWEELVEEGKHSAELGRVAKLVNEGNSGRFITILERHINSNNPLVTFTTCHKSKGREFTQVIVESDFKSCYDEDGEWKGLSTEEQNLLYVAVTRAIDVLEYNFTVDEYIQHEKVDGGVRRSPRRGPRKPRDPFAKIRRDLANKYGIEEANEGPAYEPWDEQAA